LGDISICFNKTKIKENVKKIKNRKQNIRDKKHFTPPFESSKTLTSTSNWFFSTLIMHKTSLSMLMVEEASSVEIKYGISYG